MARVGRGLRRWRRGGRCRNREAVFVSAFTLAALFATREERFAREAKYMGKLLC